jgi:predicted ABC-type ATPase
VASKPVGPSGANLSAEPRRRGSAPSPVSTRTGSVYVLAGCNGAGKSSIGGAALLASGVPFFNPDAAARRITVANAQRVPSPGQTEINAAAWNEGRRLLQRAIELRLDFAFETTLGGKTMTELLETAARAGLRVHVWFAGLDSVELHLERVRRRVAKGGHDIPEQKIRERFDRGRENLIRLLPALAALRVYDNSAEGDPDAGIAPRQQLLLHSREGRIVAPAELASLAQTPAWAKSIVAAVLKLHLRQGE